MASCLSHSISVCVRKESERIVIGGRKNHPFFKAFCCAAMPAVYLRIYETSVGVLYFIININFNFARLMGLLFFFLSLSRRCVF